MGCVPKIIGCMPKKGQVLFLQTSVVFAHVKSESLLLGYVTVMWYCNGTSRICKTTPPKECKCKGRTVGLKYNVSLSLCDYKEKLKKIVENIEIGV
jgi:hypothetical protein